MQGTRRWYLLTVQGVAIGCFIGGCNAVLGLDQFSVETAEQQPDASTGSGGNQSDASTGDAPNDNNQPDAAEEGAPAPECTTNAECTEKATREAPPNAGDGGSTDVPAVCQKPEGRCVQLLSQDCNLVTGDYLDDNAVLIGSLFQMSNTTVSQNLPRQQSATLAVEQINMFGGVPSSTAGVSRPLVMVSCDAAADLDRAATHLTSDLRVPAIVGPNTSQDTIDVSNRVTVRAGVVAITPSAVAASIARLDDNDFTWLMMPNDVQRGPLMRQQINQLETELKASRNKSTLKLGVVYRDDAMGQGTVDCLNDLSINGERIGHSSNLGINVRIDRYAASQTDFSAIIDSQATFGADIIVLAGTSEAITGVMTPLEQSSQWPNSDRPYYVGIDPFRGQALLDAVTGVDPVTGKDRTDLRRRWRGTGLAPGPLYDAFSGAYIARYPGQKPSGSGTGPAYDAAYAIAYALAATRDLPVTGANIVQGLRRLAGGPTKIGTGTLDLTTAFQKLGDGENIDASGTFAPLAWDANGAVTGGTIEIWCIGLLSTGAPTYKSSGITWDLSQPQPSGAYQQCE